MKQKGFGCFTITALIAVFITLAIIATIWAISGGEMFSPGRLNGQLGGQVLGGVQSHTQTGGKCEACHGSPFGAVTMDERCQA